MRKFVLAAVAAVSLAASAAQADSNLDLANQDLTIDLAYGAVSRVIDTHPESAWPIREIQVTSWAAGQRCWSIVSTPLTYNQLKEDMVCVIYDGNKIAVDIMILGFTPPAL